MWRDDDDDENMIIRIIPWEYNDEKDIGKKCESFGLPVC